MGGGRGYPPPTSSPSQVCRRSLAHRLHDHVLPELVAIQEGPQILQRLGNKGPIGPLNRGYARSPDLIGNYVDVAKHRSTAAENSTNGGAQVRLIFDDRCLQPIGTSDLTIIGDRHPSFRTASYVRPAKVVGLTGPNRRVSLVVENKKLDRQLVAMVANSWMLS